MGNPTTIRRSAAQPLRDVRLGFVAVPWIRRT